MLVCNAGRNKTNVLTGMFFCVCVRVCVVGGSGFTSNYFVVLYLWYRWIYQHCSRVFLDQKKTHGRRNHLIRWASMWNYNQAETQEHDRVDDVMFWNNLRLLRINKNTLGS